MAHWHIKEFASDKETIEDFLQRFEFYFTANNIKAKDEAHAASSQESPVCDYVRANHLCQASM